MRSSARLEELDAQRLIYHLPKPGPDGRTQLQLSPLELIGRIAALVPPPRLHRHRYYGVLAPNSPLRAAITALAPQVSPPPALVTSVAEGEAEGPGRPNPARYLWAILLACIYEAFPLTCTQCGAEMRIIAFVTEGGEVCKILEHVGEPSTPGITRYYGDTLPITLIYAQSEHLWRFGAALASVGVLVARVDSQARRGLAHP